MPDDARRPPRHPLRLSVFFPCHNEEMHVERVTAQALAACRKISDDFEIIIVDDGSTDRTPQLADALAQRHPQVRAVHNRPNRGYGGALQRGFREAAKDWVFYTDGDGQFDFEEIGQLLPLLEQFDIVAGYRMDRKESLVRRFNAWGWTMLVNVVFGLRVRDVDCAFKIYPRRLFDEIEMHSLGALIDAEVLARARVLDYTIGQIGVHHYARQGGEQSGANLKVIARAFVELFRLRRSILASRRSSRSSEHA